MKLIYLPGFGGNMNSKTFQNLINKYPKSIFVDYNNTNADIANKQITSLFEFLDKECYVVVGQSLGGFWAEYFAIKYNYSVILINPSLKPSESLAKYNLTKAELDIFKKYQGIKIVQSKISIIVSKNDTIVNPETVICRYQNDVPIKYIDCDHQINQYETLFTEIQFRVLNDFL